LTPRRQRRVGLPALAVLVPVLIAVLGGAVLAFGGLGREVPAAGGNVREALVVDGPLTLIPAFAETPNSRDVSGLLYRGLTRPGPDARPVGELAQSWTVDAAAKTFTFHLRRGLRWSDGAPLTSADALFTLSVLLSDADAKSATGQAWAGISATAPDGLTVVYSLPQSSAAFLALTNIGLLPEHALKPRAITSLRRVTDAPTSGPFRIARVFPDHLDLERNPHAFERPYIDRLELRLYDSRDRAVQALVDAEVDLFGGMTAAEARRVSQAMNRRVISGSSFAYAELLFNQKTDALADARVRAAIEEAVDRRAILDQTLAGYARAAGSPIPAAISWAALATQGPHLDLAAAGRQLDAAGWKREGKWRIKDGHRLELRIATPDADPYTSVVAAIERDLGKVGIFTTTQARSPESLLSLLESRQFELALTAVDNGPDPDIYVFWHSSQGGPGGFNFSGMAKSDALDKDLEDGRSTPDYGQRRKAYLDAQQAIIGAQAAVFLYSPESLVGARDTVKGIALPAGGQRYDLVQGWYVNATRKL
jgi:peptide/nickel transport system substrate-binding protein